MLPLLRSHIGLAVKQGHTSLGTDLSVSECFPINPIHWCLQVKTPAVSKDMNVVMSGHCAPKAVTASSSSSSGSKTHKSPKVLNILEQLEKNASEDTEESRNTDVGKQASDLTKGLQSQDSRLLNVSIITSCGTFIETLSSQKKHCVFAIKSDSCFLELLH